MGNKHKIMFGVFVNYEQKTIDAYRDVLKDIYNRALKVFYETNPLEIPKETIKEIIKSKEMKQIGLTYHSFFCF